MPPYLDKLTAQMKYYIYISDSKLDMLYAQIPRSFLSRIAAELTLKLPFFDASVKASSPDSSKRFSKLKAVENHILSHYNVGSPDENTEYFRGTLNMNWGHFEGDQAIAFFFGWTEKTVVALGGSLKHVLGSMDGLPGGWHSHAPPLLRALESELGLDPVNLPDGYLRVLPDGPFFSQEQQNQLALSAAFDAGNCVRRGRGKSGQLLPAQRLEFLAKRLIYGKAAQIGRDPETGDVILQPRGDNPVLLGTPIYVALASEE